MREILTLSQVRSLLRDQQVNEVVSVSDLMHAPDLAELLEELDLGQAVQILGLLSVDRAIDVFNYLGDEFGAQVADLLNLDRMVAIVSGMPHDERVDLLQSLSQDKSESILRRLARAEREDILRLSSYPEGTAGAIMTSDYARLSPVLTAREALDTLRLEGPSSETIYYAYVIGDDWELLGSVSLKDLILAKMDTKLDEIMTTDLIKAWVNEDQEDVARKLAKYDLLAIPVVDENNSLKGIVTFDDALDVSEEEATQDFHLMASVSGQIAVGLGDTDIWTLAKKRVPWLLVLIFVNIFSGAGIAHYQDIVESNLVLVFFLPLLIASGGNAGSQSTTLMIRALATGEVTAKDWLRLFGREVFVSLALGLAMAGAVALLGVWRGGPNIALVVAVSMVACVLVGSLIGFSLPFFLTKWGMDPATASSPLVTSLADIAGVLIYLGTASLLLPALA